MRFPTRTAATLLPCLALATLGLALTAAPSARADEPARAGTAAEAPAADAGADAGTAKMEVLEATDAAGLRAAVGKMAVVSGKVESAAWSRSGKVCSIRFEGVDRDGFQAVVFDADRKKLDAAYAGDLAATLAGKTVKVRGVVQAYAGQQGSQEGRPEVVVRNDSQITIVPDADADAATTKPAA